MIYLLAGLGPVGESRVRLSVLERQGARRRGDQSDKSLADAKPRAMYGFRPQTLGSEQFEDFAGAHDVDRADLCDHLRGDDTNDTVEPVLRVDGAGHDVAEPAQQPAGSADATWNLVHPCMFRRPDTASPDKGAR